MVVDDDECIDGNLFSKLEEIFGNVRWVSNFSDLSFLLFDDEDCIKNRNFNSFEMSDVECDLVFFLFFNNLWIVIIMFKIFMILMEVKYMWRILVLLDLGVLDFEERLYKDLVNGRLCFCC